MRKIKLLALDLDGTLFNSKKEVSQSNKEALRLARERGVQVVITTGRPLKAIEHLLYDLDMVSEQDYSITFNGGLVQRNTGEILDKSQFTRAEIEAIYEVLEALALPMDVLSDGDVYSLASQGNHSLYHTANPMLAFHELASLADIPHDIIYNKVVVVIEQDFLDQQIDQLPSQLYQDFEVFKSRDIILEIMPKGVHKAVGLDLLTQHLDLRASDVMAMGDEANDLTMLAWAGLGIAMQNATDSVKKTANAVTKLTNEESGVAEAIHTYILNEE